MTTFHRSGGSALYTVLGPLARRLARRFAVRAPCPRRPRATAFAALGGAYEVGFNGVEVDRYGDVVPWPTDRPTVLFLGRHEERKGLRSLLDAFEDLAGQRGHGTGRRPRARRCGSPETAR